MSPRTSIAVAVEPDLLPTLADLRLVLVTDEHERAEDVCAALTRWGAQVVHAPSIAQALAHGASLDPQAILLDPSRLVLRKGELREQLLAHPRAAWGRPLRWRLRDLLDKSPPDGGLGGLVRRVAPLVEPDRTVAGLARYGRSSLFPVPIAQIGPARTLRALSRGRGLLRISAVTGDARASVEVQDGCIRDARYEPGCGPGLDGPAAIEAFLRMAPETGFVERERPAARPTEGMPVARLIRIAA